MHALGQVASVRTRTEHSCTTLQRAFNSVLPVDVRVVAVEDAAPDFHARFSAVSKTYEYRIVQGPFVSPFDQRFVWHVTGKLDVEAMPAWNCTILLFRRSIHNASQLIVAACCDLLHANCGILIVITDD